MSSFRPIRTLLVANRGEIARRILRSAMEMGMRTVAVYAAPDEGEPFVDEADVAVPLHGDTAATSYLDVARLLEAARGTGADAIHPGYGFLAERADFATACRDADLTWVGPSPAAIAAMGSKIEAKATVRASGVPLLPDAVLPDEGDPRPTAAPVGYPLLVKAAFGGGGRGMRVVRDEAELVAAVESARREAASAFGDATLLVERYVASGRHVEIQVLGDEHGHLVHCFERDCTVQRRHQKVVEEAPSPAVSPELRARMGAAAVAAGKTIGYTNAGTVEFLLDGDDFFFLEMNTRLQVEHPVTEAVTGLDLVRCQLEIATGETLPVGIDDLRLSGHAVEARLYAEDPERGVPSTGRLHRFEPGPTPGLRYDAGVETGSRVSVAFDPMLAKVVAHAPTRTEALARLARGLLELQVHGVRTNRDQLLAVLRSEDFRRGDVDTNWLERLPIPRQDHEVVRIHAIAAALAGQEERRRAAPVLGTVPSGWRNLRSAGQQITFQAGDEPWELEYEVTKPARASTSGAATVRCGGRTEDVRFRPVDGGRLDLRAGGVRRRVSVHRVGETSFVNTEDGQSELVTEDRFPGRGAGDVAGGCVAPVPGRVTVVAVAPGDEVAAGDVVAVIEAMKMEHRIVAHEAGTVVEVRVREGDGVEHGELLAVVHGVEHDGATDRGEEE